MPPRLAILDVEEDFALTCNLSGMKEKAQIQQIGTGSPLFYCQQISSDTFHRALGKSLRERERERERERKQNSKPRTLRDLTSEQQNFIEFIWESRLRAWRKKL